MLIDSFIFLNELDLLEIRLNELDSIVDRFILVESSKTFSNKEKPLFFSENKKRFSPFLHKIQQVVLTELPAGDNPWIREIYQRKVLLKVLRDMPSNSICMVSDIDEIPSKESVKKSFGLLNDKKHPLVFYHHFCHGFLNQVLTKSSSWSLWGGTRIAPRSYWSEDKGGRELPGSKESVINGGWHFRNVGDDDFISFKLKSYSHHKDNNSDGIIQENLSKDQIRNRIDQGKELCQEGFLGKEFNENFWPDYVRQNKLKFQNLLRKW